MTNIINIKNNIILVLVLTLILINTTSAKYVMHDKIILKTCENINLKSEIKEHIKIIKFITLSKSSQIDLKNKVLSDMIILNSYPDVIKKYNITVEDEWIDMLYKDSAEKYNTSISKFKNTISEKFKIKEKSIITFITETLALTNLQKINLSEEIIISDNDINDFFHASNYINFKKPLHDFKIIQISFIRKGINNFKKIKNIINILKNTDDAQRIINNVNVKNINIKKIDINSQNKKYIYLKDFIEKENQTNIIGPICAGKYIYFFKILEKKLKTDDYKPYIKICHYTVQKKKIDEGKRTSKFVKLKTNASKKDTKILFKESKKGTWIYKDNVEPGFYDKIKHLKINEVSELFETQTGWHIIKVIDRTFDQKSNIYTYIENSITSEKITNLNQQWENKTVTNAHTIFYN